MPQLTIFITFKIDPSKTSEWRAAHKPVWDACAQEPECLFFDIFHDPKELGTFRFVEIWSKDREWFENVQMKKPYYAEMFPESEKTWREPPTMEFYERGVGGGEEVCVFREGFLSGGRKVD